MTVTVRSYNISAPLTSANILSRIQTAMSDMNWLTEVDFGISLWTTLSSTSVTNFTSQQRYTVTPQECSLSGANLPKVLIRRDYSGGNGILGTLQMATSGSNWRGRGGHNGTYSQSGTTTVTVTFAAHGLSTGDRIYLNFTATTGTPPTSGLYTITKLNNNQIQFTSSVSATSSGTAVAQGFAGTYERITNNCIVNCPNHSITNGTRVYFTPVTGGVTTSTLSPSVTVIDADNFSFTLSGDNTTGIGYFNHTFLIKGSQTGGIDGTDDIRVKIDKCLGVSGSSTTFPTISTTTIDTGNTYNYALWQMVMDPTKTYGKQFIVIVSTGGELYTMNTPVWDPQLNNAGGLSSAGEYRPYILSSATDIYTNVNSPLTMTTYQSGLDPDFAVFSFNNSNSHRESIIFHKFKPMASAPYDLDQLSQGGVTKISRFDNTNLVFDTLVNTGKLCGESGYLGPDNISSGQESYNHLRGRYQSSERYNYYLNDYNVRVWSNQFNPISSNIGPIIYRLPINPSMCPPFYFMPDDFSIASTGGTDTAPGDVIIVTSSVEEYKVVISANNVDFALAFLARTV